MYSKRFCCGKDYNQHLFMFPQRELDSVFEHLAMISHERLPLFASQFKPQSLHSRNIERETNPFQNKILSFDRNIYRRLRIMPWLSFDNEKLCTDLVCRPNLKSLPRQSAKHHLIGNCSHHDNFALASQTPTSVVPKFRLSSKIPEEGYTSQP